MQWRPRHLQHSFACVCCRRSDSVRRMDPAGSAEAAAHAEATRAREEEEVERDDPERLAQTRAMDEYKDGAHSSLALALCTRHSALVLSSASSIGMKSTSISISVSTRILLHSVFSARSVACSAPAGRGKPVSPRLTPLLFSTPVSFTFKTPQLASSFCVRDPLVVHSEHKILLDYYL